MDSRVVWCVMEMPNLIWAVVFMSGMWPPASASDATIHLPWDSLATANKILLSMFVYHYVYRTLIYPFRLHQSSKVPLGIGTATYTFPKKQKPELHSSNSPFLLPPRFFCFLIYHFEWICPMLRPDQGS